MSGRGGKKLQKENCAYLTETVTAMYKNCGAVHLNWTWVVIVTLAITSSPKFLNL
jgi:hypothetical protein